MNYPVKFKLAIDLVDELRECELGSWEDYTNLRASTDADDHSEADDMIYGSVHRYAILGRVLENFPAHMHSTRGMVTVVLANADEVAEVYYAAVSGTFQIRDADDEGSERRYRAACRICDTLRSYLLASADADHHALVRQWPAPLGG